MLPQAVRSKRVTCADYDRSVRPRDAIEMLAGSGVGELTNDVGGSRLWRWNVHPCARRPACVRAASSTRWTEMALPCGRSRRHTRASASQHTAAISRTRCGHSIASMAFSWPTRCTTSTTRRRSSAHAKRGCDRRRFLVVEHDTREASRWLPYPVPQTRLTALFTAAGYSSIRLLRSRPSVFRRGALYAVPSQPLI